jgi:hypothetical protein
MPKAADIGDHVCILHGSKVPVILRKAPGTENFKLIGQAYVEHGMHGEAVTWTVEDAGDFLLV